MNILQRIALWVLGRYEAAQYSTSRSRVSGSLTSPRFDIDKMTREELTRIAIIFEQNNPILQRVADIWETYTVGSGIQITPASSDSEWNRNAKEWHNEWEQFPDVASLQDFSTLMGLVSRSWLIQGGKFILFVNGESRNGNGSAPFPRLQLIEGRLCETPPKLKEFEGISIIDGVQIDPKTMRPVGYFFAQDGKSAGQKLYPEAATPADQVIHHFEPSRAGQYRELTMLHAVLNELRDLNDLHHLEMLACKDAARKSNVVKRKSGELNAANLIRHRLQITQQGATSVSVNNTEDRAKYVSDVLGGETVCLELGEELEQHRTERPSVTTTDYWRYKTELVCNGVGIPICMVFPALMQGTVYRGALDMASEFFRQRHKVISGTVKRIYLRNIKWAIRNDSRLKNPPQDWFKVIIHPPRAPNVDVGYNSAAAINEVSAGLSNYSIYYGQRGLDWREQLKQKAEEAKYIRELSEQFGVDIAEISSSQKEKLKADQSMTNEDQIPITEMR